MRIIISATHFDKSANEVRDYYNTIDVDDDVLFDYRKFYDVLRTLYPRAKFITFQNEISK